MKFCEVRIKPRSSFGTPLKGDTVFGQFCWQVKYDPEILNGGLDFWISCYHERPFGIFSTAWPVVMCNNKSCYALKTPDYPLKAFSKASYEDRSKFYEERKRILKKRWVIVGEDLQLKVDRERMKTDEEVFRSAGLSLSESSIMREFVQDHNTINRITMTTGEDQFAPYIMRNFVYHPDLELAIFVLFDEEATDVERIKFGFERMGKFGYGRDASTGLGRFDVLSVREIAIPVRGDAVACYTLAPSVPEKDLYSEVFFVPFTRFGRHGDFLATSSNPFKAPIIMADEGAVLFPSSDVVWSKPYLGCAIKGVSKVEVNTVSQGYSIYLPISLE
ncbi:MAG: hypothetical protein N2317_08495 [Syntrophales bacterium]|nr:hypothetical protein [Syntrophales bacterium]